MESQLDLGRSSSGPLFTNRLELVGLADELADADRRPTTALLARKVIPAPITSRTCSAPTGATP